MFLIHFLYLLFSAKPQPQDIAPLAKLPKASGGSSFENREFGGRWLTLLLRRSRAFLAGRKHFKTGNLRDPGLAARRCMLYKSSMTKPVCEYLIIQLCVFLLLGQCCFSNREVETRVYTMPDSIVQEIGRAAQGGNFSCAKKTLFSRDFFELGDDRLLILLGIPDYLCASNSFMPVTVDDQGQWLAGRPMPGAPSWLVRGADDALWLAAQWQVEGTFPALYRSLDGVDWQEIKLPEDRNVDCCFERLTRICFHPGAVRLKFEGDAAGAEASWEAGLDGLDAPGPGPVWKPVAAAHEGADESSCPFVPLGHGSWVRMEAEQSKWIYFKKNRMYLKTSLVIPGSLE